MSVIKNVNFQAGQTLTVVGVVTNDPKRFAVNIGPSKDRIAFHFNPRFNHLGDINTIVCNSFEAGKWCEEQRYKCFPFSERQEFKIDIKFTLPEFVVTLPGGTMFCFPNRIGAEKYSILSFDGDVHILSTEIK